ncbi:uncharacterized protein LOC110820314 isoform X2 [Carica papaya]|uniref:uncharacterized protein LOC110820314 isoform X2 n=1 Tax=Carica papaya TaxID=3649 RepID=UPI000B8C8D3F|nr:uncharacterized protein LOC110820314 isoform X2 [Carica papaya]
MRVYLCDHETSPPEDQQIKTNQQNILIRSLALKKQKSDSSSKGVKETAAEGPRKRTAERALDGRASAKKANSQISSHQGSNSGAAERDLQALTVERLRALLKEKGLSLKGKKDELIARLKSVNS